MPAAFLVRVARQMSEFCRLCASTHRPDSATCLCLFAQVEAVSVLCPGLPSVFCYDCVCVAAGLTAGQLFYVVVYG